MNVTISKATGHMGDNTIVGKGNGYVIINWGGWFFPLYHII